jgi:hypothetical protein
MTVQICRFASLVDGGDAERLRTIDMNYLERINDMAVGVGGSEIVRVVGRLWRQVEAHERVESTSLSKERQSPASQRRSTGTWFGRAPNLDSPTVDCGFSSKGSYCMSHPSPQSRKDTIHTFTHIKISL